MSTQIIYTRWLQEPQDNSSVSPANHSTNFSIITITRGWHNRLISGRSAEWTQLDSTPHYTNLKNLIPVKPKLWSGSCGQFGGFFSHGCHQGQWVIRISSNDNINMVRFDVITAMVMNGSILCDVTQGSPLKSNEVSEQNVISIFRVEE
jgi:hypothetical protein